MRRDAPTCVSRVNFVFTPIRHDRQRPSIFRSTATEDRSAVHFIRLLVSLTRHLVPPSPIRWARGISPIRCGEGTLLRFYARFVAKSGSCHIRATSRRNDRDFDCGGSAPATTPLLAIQSLAESGVALCFPPQSKRGSRLSPRRVDSCRFVVLRFASPCRNRFVMAEKKTIGWHSRATRLP